MRIIAENIKHGIKTIIPESQTDLFLLTKIIDKGDLVTAKTNRRVHRKDSENRGGDKGERITMILTILVEESYFQDSEVDKKLRVKGTIREGPTDYVSPGSNHTLNIETGFQLTITKELWSRYHISLLEEAQKAIERPTICLIAIEQGIGTIALVDNYHINIIAKEQRFLPGKFSKAKQRDAAEKQFYRYILEILLEQVPHSVKNFIIGGPGNTKNYLYNFLQEHWQIHDKIIMIEHLSSGTIFGIREMVSRGIIDKIAADYAAIKIEKLLEEFEEKLLTDSAKVSYGLSTIHRLLQQGAVETLLISDLLVRSPNQEKKELITELFSLIDQTRAKFFILDHTNAFHKKIEIFGHIIAFLRYAIYETEEHNDYAE